ncbi:MAG: ABC transporter substrate-binding protein [Victivallaceae bacterium]|nr:ABC transporter substrate-binding protein [Victivallaceae bacterium]
MYKNVFLNFIATVALIALIVLGYVMISAVDRLHDDNNRIGEKLTRLENRIEVLGTNPAAVAAPVTAEERIDSSNGTIANLEFFDRNSQPGGRIIRRITSDTQNLNTLINNDSTASTFHGLTDSTLAERNLKNINEFEPLMAESWIISPDKKVYTIKLRKGILWHDFTDPVSGKEWRNVEVTAADFKFYVDVIKNKDTNCGPMRSYYKQLDRIEVINRYKFKVFWKQRYYQSKIFTLGMSPLPRHLYHAYPEPFDGKKFNDDHRRNRVIVGCGPYRFLRWDKGQRVIFTRWSKYFGKKYGIMPPISNIAFDLIKHPNTAFQALKAGKLDSFNLEPEQWIKRTDTKEFKPGGSLAKYKYLYRAYYYLGYNLKNPLFTDKRVRQAMTHLVNRRKILQDVCFNLGKIVTGPFFVDSKYYDKSIKPYEFSVAEARRLLGEAGWKDRDGDGVLDKNGKKFEFTIMQVANHPVQQKMLPIIKEDMAKAGIVMNIKSFEWSVYLQRLEKKKFEVCCLGWTSSLDPDPYQLWHSSGADKNNTSNHIGFKNKRADEIIEELRITFDMDKRLKLAHEFHQLLHDEQPYTFLFSRDALVAQSTRYKNVRKFPLGYPDSIIWTPKKEQRAIPGF